MFFVLPVEVGNPPKKIPLMNIFLIGLNIYVFFKTATRLNFEQIVLRNGFTPAHPHFQDVVVSMFPHRGADRI